MWIKASDKYPECDWWLAREIATGKRLPMLFATHVIAGVGGKTYKPYEVEYFDESPASDPAEVLVKALEWYADKDNYTADNGEFATAWRDQMDYKAVKALKTYQDEMGKGK